MGVMNTRKRTRFCSGCFSCFDDGQSFPSWTPLIKDESEVVFLFFMRPETLRSLLPLLCTSSSSSQHLHNGTAAAGVVYYYIGAEAAASHSLNPSCLLPFYFFPSFSSHGDNQDKWFSSLSSFSDTVSPSLS